MFSNSTFRPAVACVPGAIPALQRSEHFALAAKLFENAALSTSELKDGYEFRFPAQELASVARFVANERLCCPFIRFEIVVDPGAEECALRMTGPDGTRAILAAELKLKGRSLSGCDCHDA